MNKRSVLCILVTILTISIFLAACDNGSTSIYPINPDPAFYGTWIDGEGDIVIISANKLEYVDGYVLENLIWTAITRSDNEYIYGYKISGEVTIYSGFAPFTDAGYCAAVGEIGHDYWFIHSDGQSLVWGDWVRWFAGGEDVCDAPDEINIKQH